MNRDLFDEGEAPATVQPGGAHTEAEGDSKLHGDGSTTYEAELARILRKKSTNRKDQTSTLLFALKHRPHHTYELRKMGISHPAGRVQDLEADGHLISSARITVVDENGFAHPGTALYSLVGKKSEVEE